MSEARKRKPIPARLLPTEKIAGFWRRAVMLLIIKTTKMGGAGFPCIACGAGQIPS